MDPVTRSRLQQLGARSKSHNLQNSHNPEGDVKKHIITGLRDNIITITVTITIITKMDVDTNIPDLPMSGQSDAMPPLLRLPREIRDEIYKHLLLFPTPPTPTGVTSYYNLPQYHHPKVDLAILRVNKQIHDEAATLFYTRNTFLVRVTVNGYQPSVRLEAPWGRRTFSAEKYPHGRFDAPVKRSTGSHFRCQRHPSAGYLALVRHIRVDVFDFCWQGISSNKPERRRWRKALLPVVHRLQMALGDDGSNVNMTIRLMMEGKWNVSGISSIGVDIYRRGIETAWGLTTAPWRWSLDIPDELLTHFPGVAEQALLECQYSS
ncbi:hypothetical protein TWF696_000272 [Orbilia brochopaga]|uniref:F-box domain-containing protein n=1 Tax=Orbilia brochopaga TaxID=3140254 RepID=A0AAV9VAW6_9PEZI